jgi:hypothetical protein
MEGFKANPKMKSDISCYKEGGYVSRKKKEDHEDVAMDKEVVKKGVRQHEAAKHKGEEKTELKLKGGRRVKKTGGVVNKFKTGGVCNPMKTGGLTNAMKNGGDVKKTPAAKGPAAKKSKEPKKYADGSSVGSMRAGKQSDMSDMLLQQAAQAAQGSQGGMGSAQATGGMGAAYPMGAEEDLIRGIRAVGRAMGGRI